MSDRSEAIARAKAWLTEWESPREVWTDCEPLAQDAASIIAALLAELAEARLVIEPFAKAGDILDRPLRLHHGPAIFVHMGCDGDHPAARRQFHPPTNEDFARASDFNRTEGEKG